MNDEDHRFIVDLRVLREQFLVNLKTTDYAQINAGNCENFAQAITAIHADADMVGIEEYSLNSGLDWRVCAPPEGYTREQVQAADPGGHLWLVRKNRHYDAECPKGVDNFFDLPFFKRQLTRHFKPN